VLLKIACSYLEYFQFGTSCRSAYEDAPGKSVLATSYVTSHRSSDYLTSGSFFGRLAMNLSSTLRCALTNSGGSTPIHWASEMSA
jgi:hypothetical protein